MAFDRGTVNFTVFKLDGKLPEDLTAAFAAHPCGALDSAGAEPETGWAGGSHILETSITDATVKAGGYCNLFLRTAVRKMPAMLLNAYCRRAECDFMRDNQRETVPAAKRREIREAVLAERLDEMPPSVSAIPVAVDPMAGRLYAGCSSNTQIELLCRHVYEALKVEPLQLTPGLLLNELFQMTETEVPPLELATAAGGEKFIGRDFLMWLWYRSECGMRFKVDGAGTFEPLIEGPVIFASPDDDDAKGSGVTSVKNGGSPMRSAEVKAALSVGKKLRRAKLTLADNDAGRVWTCNFDADKFSFSSMKLPEGEELARQDALVERLGFLDNFTDAVICCFRRFIEQITGPERAALIKSMREWSSGRDGI